MKTETRSFVGTELRAADGEEFVITGLAAPYNKKTKIAGVFTEQVAKGAFARSLREGADVCCLFNHDPSRILGRTKSGTLTLTDSPEGLRFRCELDKSSQSHRDIYASVKRGDTSECSFAFTVPKGGDEWDGDQRTLRDVNLLDVSVVTSPAYPGTSADARSSSNEERTSCDCDCDECKAGDCDECSDEDCDCEGCTDCGQRSKPDDVTALRHKLEAVRL